jgi:arylsulfatase A-like enzyme
MKPINITRRDFIKLIGLTPLLLTKWPGFAPPSQNNPVLPHSINSTPPSILVFVFDALSARHMSLYGYPRKTTANIERLAERATVYHRHYASANFTSPGTASIFTGGYPWTHRALQMRSQALERFANRNLFSALAEENYHTFAYTHNTFVQILFEQFRQSIQQLLQISDLTLSSNSFSDQYFGQDYFVANEAELLLLKNEYDPPSSLFASILDRLNRLYQTRKLNESLQNEFPRGAPNCQTGKPSVLCFRLEDTIDWLKAHIGVQESPYFGYVHVLPPHAPYNPARDFIGYFEDNWQPPVKPENHFTQYNNQKKLNRLRRQYDEFIAYADFQFGRLLDYMVDSGALDNTTLVVTSDHGEMFERGIQGHVTPTLYEPIIHIPLLVSLPGQAQRQDIYTPTNNVDLMPTLQKFVGGNPLDGIEGQVLPGFNEQSGSSDRNIFAVEAKQNAKNGPLNIATFAVLRENYKLIAYKGYPGFDGIYELYDLDKDPEELNDIYSSSNSIAIELHKILESSLAISSAMLHQP